MSTSTPYVTVILPVYNSEHFIAETIQSVLKQTLDNWELLVINDGSTDKTKDVIFSFKDRRIRVFEQNNAGVSSARNIGLLNSRGQYITFLDADDTLPSHSLKVRAHYLNSHPTVDLVDGNISVKDINMNADIMLYEPYYEGKLFPRLIALDNRVFFNVCYMFKKDIIGKTQFKEKMTHAEDLLFYIELSNKYKVQYGFVSEIIYYYRSGHLSAMNNLGGLEKGYFMLLDEVNKLRAVSLFQKISIHLKITRIIFLSWLRHGSIIRAFKGGLMIVNIFVRQRCVK